MRSCSPITLACLLLCFSLAIPISAQFSGGGEANPGLTTHAEALKEFRDMRFGLFIHWGPVSLRGEEISWSRGREIPVEEYDALYKEFRPEGFDAAQWVGAAKSAGMKYLVITSRHHDGFSLWDSRYSEYDMASTPYGKGILKDLARECERQGIKFGVYYSICDWYHEDYPVVYPDPGDGDPRAKVIDAATWKKMDRYVTFMKNQLRELIGEYDPFVIWFDGEWEWAWTHEMGMDMYAYLRGLKEDLLINNRVDKGRAGMEGYSRDPRYAGDFATPEQSIGEFDRRYAWETCMTIGEQWAWKPGDCLKSKKECIHTLLHTIGGDGNLLLNVGPMPTGRIENRQLDILADMGTWISKHREAVYGTRGGPYIPSETMVSTHKGNRIFLHLLQHPGKELTLPLPKGNGIQSASFLVNGEAVPFMQTKASVTLKLPAALPDKTAAVVVLELDQNAREIQAIELSP
jgi:alpha-L-fucosidase